MVTNQMHPSGLWEAFIGPLDPQAAPIFLRSLLGPHYRSPSQVRRPHHKEMARPSSLIGVVFSGRLPWGRRQAGPKIA